MKLLFIGDIVGRPGRDLVRPALAAIVARYDIDFVIANGENAAAGFGITRDIGEQLFSYGIEVMTSGNHIWDKKEVLDYLPREPRLLRPANFPAGAPGTGAYLATAANGVKVGVVNVMGRVFLAAIDDPFTTAAREVARLKAEGAQLVFVDVHAEVTSEKIAMGWYLDGAATAVVGTHTHVQTADDRVLPQGTAYLTDVGMTGPARRRHRRGEGAGHRQVPERPAGPLRNRQRRSAPERRRHHRRPGHGPAPPASNASACLPPTSTAWRGADATLAP